MPPESQIREAIAAGALPGMDPDGFHTTASDYYGIKKMRLQRFDGKAWVPFGEPIGV